MSASAFSTQLLTRQDCIDQLPQGSDQLVIDLHLAATARSRHDSRVARVRAVARTYLESPELYIEITDRMIATLCAIEVGGIGGRGGYRGDRLLVLGALGFRAEDGSIAATGRMSWAASGCGSGRRQAADGAAWTAAIAEVAGNAPPSVDDVHAIMLAVVDRDLAWPLAHALHGALACSDDATAATAWAALAREIAERVEPDSSAGKLAQRYNLRTLDPLVSFHGQLTAEIIADMLGLAEADLLARVDGGTDALVEDESGPLTVTIYAADELCVPFASPDDRLFRVDVSTRNSYSEGVCEAMHRAWVSVGLSMHSESRAEVVRMCHEIQPWAMAPDARDVQAPSL